MVLGTVLYVSINPCHTGHFIYSIPDSVYFLLEDVCHRRNLIAITGIDVRQLRLLIVVGFDG
jgi:hypothetical protein